MHHRNERPLPCRLHGLPEVPPHQADLYRPQLLTPAGDGSCPAAGGRLHQSWSSYRLVTL